MYQDVLASFNQPAESKPAQPVPTSTQSGTSSSEASRPKASVEDGDEEDFEASLVEGMESLLRQLAGDNPPGPMAGTTNIKPGARGDRKGLSADEEEKAFQRAIEMMLSKEGIDALGLDDLDGEGGKPLLPPSLNSENPTSTSTSSSSKPSANSALNANGSSSSNSGRPDPASFEETIRKAMESLNTAGERKPGTSDGMGGMPSDPAELAKLLAQLGNDPNLDLEGDDELSGILDGMMGQLMTREVLEEPMSELASKVS